ncbi:hypothetical protein PENTCL1PPCAC_23233 [Pristionchus entomophagus]|uniref:BTB domain-containing protein n=1 Tax=Pristionchus entomophagus TaxID=358040 RepID=A0AAV5U4K9_9BILA|nr:hypothetical protein PENTCL1PPCAC_23233 [Pristionchus entomophagus]
MDTKGEMHEVVEERNQNGLFAPHKPYHMKYVKNDTIEIEVEIHVEQEARDRFRKKLAINFLAPSEMFDSELSVGGKKIHVNKQFISMHSSIFKAHFYGGPNEELKLEDMDAQAFIEFLKMLYRAENSVTAANAEDVLFMADRFKTQCLVDHVEKFLFATGDVEVSDRIRIAEKYNLLTLMRGALLVLEKNPTAGKEVIDSAAFKSYSAKTKKAVKDANMTAEIRRYMDSDEEDMDDYMDDYMDEMGLYF